MISGMVRLRCGSKGFASGAAGVGCSFGSSQTSRAWVSRRFTGSKLAGSLRLWPCSNPVSKLKALREPSGRTRYLTDDER